MLDKYISLEYGSGGTKTSALIEELLLPNFSNEALSQLGDGAVLSGAQDIVFSTDSFVISPYMFPGGDVGKLAVCGTVNDVAMAGGEPRYLSLSAIIEEGFPTDDLEVIVRSAAKAARDAGCQIVTGDTKVVEKGKGDGIYLNTSGIGILRCPGLSPDNIREGDRVLVSGTIADHGTAIMLERNKNLLKGAIESDCAPLNRLAAKLYSLKGSLKVLRDPTRGGLATTLCEFAQGRDFSIELEEESIPLNKTVKSACDILGLDPLYMANEGKLVAVVSAEAEQEALELMRSLSEGAQAAAVGTVRSSDPGRVYIRTKTGGLRLLAKITGTQLPRIC